MAKEYFQGDHNPGRTTDERGSIRQAILLVILLLTAGLGYVYFFTGLIKPRENVFTPPPPQVAPVKQPIPPRPTLEAGGEATPAPPPEGVAPPAAPPEKAVQPEAEQKAAPAPAAKPADTAAAKPAPAPTVKPAVTPATKPAAAPAPKPAPTVAPKSAIPAAPKPVATPAQKAVAGPAPKQPAAASKQTVKTAKGEEKPATKGEKKTPAVTPATSARTATKTTAEAPSKETSKGAKSTATKAVVAPSAAKKGYALAMGDMATAGEAEKLRGRLKNLGITNVTVKTIRKTETMHRLSLGEFSDASAAGAELSRLKPLASGAFILKENGRYALYAGSYLHAARAESEASRLSAKGFKAEIKDAKVGVQVHQVMAGSFAGNDEATKAAEKLKKNGISAEVVKLGQ